MKKLNVANIRKITESEGPGKRFAIWVQGCSIRCLNCCNPTMFSNEIKNLMSIDVIIEKIKSVQKFIDGVTIIGGEPFDQPQPISNLVQRIYNLELSVIIFTGYILEKLYEKNDKYINNILNFTDILIDSPFIEKLKSSKRKWVGSDNQRIHFLSKKKPILDLDNWPSGRQLEINFNGKTICINGDPELAKKLLGKY